MSIPVVTLGTQTVKKISDEIGKNQCVCSFTVNQNVYKWEARASKGTSPPALGVGTLVESGGFLLANKKAEVVIDDDELKSGDGMYTISVYAQNMEGYWSEGTFANIYVGMKYNTQKKYNSRRKYNCKIYD